MTEWIKENTLMSEELLRAELTALKEQLCRVQETLQEVRDKVISHVQCPSPGACLRLETWIKDLEKRTRELEKRNAYVVGACILVSAAIPLLMKLL